MYRDIGRTAAGLGTDGPAWQRLYSSLVEHADDLVDDLFRPIVAIPKHPISTARFGLRALQPATWLARRWETDEARGLFAGLAAHAISPLDRPTTGALGMMFGVFGHAYGWPVAVGGSASIATALEATLRASGGTVETGHRVTGVPDADVVLFDTSPDQVLAMASHLLPVASPGRCDAGSTDPPRSRSTSRFRTESRGPATLRGSPAPFTSAERSGDRRRRHRAVNGRMPERPFVLVCQQSPRRPVAIGGASPRLGVRHVPNGYTGDATAAVLAQIERFAPGTRERVVAVSSRTPAEAHAENANYVGGDITGGAGTPWQTVFRPRVSLDPYRLAPGLFLCSASTPPGGGVHGMAGYHAAQSALRTL